MYHYGMDYSNSASVMYYMLRMEPFTTLHIKARRFKRVIGTVSITRGKRLVIPK